MAKDGQIPGDRDGIGASVAKRDETVPRRMCRGRASRGGRAGSDPVIGVAVYMQIPGNSFFFL